MRDAGLVSDGKTDLDQLRKIVKWGSRRGTDFIDIVVKHRSPETALSLADALAQTSIRIQNEIDEKNRVEARLVFAEELRSQEKLVAQLEAKIGRAKAAVNLVDLERADGLVILSLKQHEVEIALSEVKMARAMKKEITAAFGKFDQKIPSLDIHQHAVIQE